MMTQPGTLLRLAMRAAACATIAASLLLASCGGGLSVIAGVGSGGTGLAEGIVSGFGSVIVDGVEYDDSHAGVFVTGSTGSTINTAAKLGQRVRVLFEDGNVAQSIQVLPQLAGPVTSPPDANGMLQVMGQWVRLVLNADDPTLSSVTILSGYAPTVQIAATDDVEVHGSWVFDTAKAAYVLWATRLEKLPVAMDPVELGGVVQHVGGASFKLSSHTGPAVHAPQAPADLSNGQVVRIWLPRGALNAALLEALRVDRLTLTTQEVAAQDSLRISGLASSFDADGRTVDIQGLRVQLPSDVAVDATALSKGQFVSLEVVAKTGHLVAVGASLRGVGGKELGGVVAVSGMVTGVDWTAPVVTFTVRGIDVRAARNVIASSCLASGMRTERVQVQGQIASGAGPLVATQVTCS